MNQSEHDHYIFENSNLVDKLPIEVKENVGDKPNKSAYFFSFMLLFLAGLNTFYGIVWFRSNLGKLMFASSVISLTIVLIIFLNAKLRKMYMITSLTLIVLLTGLFYIGFKDMQTNSYNVINMFFPQYIMIGEPFVPNVYSENGDISEFIEFKSEDKSFAKVVNGNIVVQKVGKGIITAYDKYGNKVSNELEYLGIEAIDYTLDYRNASVGEIVYLSPIMFPTNANDLIPTVEIMDDNDGLSRINDIEFLAIKPGIVKVKTSHPRMGDKFFDVIINEVPSSIELVVDEKTAQSRVDGNYGENYYADIGDTITVKLQIEPKQVIPSGIEWQFNDMDGSNSVGRPVDVNEVVFKFKGSVYITVFQGNLMSNTIQIIENGR